MSSCRANQRSGQGTESIPLSNRGDMEVLFLDDCGDNGDVMEQEGMMKDVAGRGVTHHTLSPNQHQQEERKKIYATDRFAISIISTLPLPIEKAHVPE